MVNQAMRLQKAKERLETKKIDLGYIPQPRQLLLHSTACRQIFYGGAAGGGKSHALRMEAIQFCLSNPGLQAYLFRRLYPELENNHIRVLRMLPQELGRFHETHKRFEFYNGSNLHCCAAEDEKSILNYRGQEMHWVGVDEASHFTPFQLGILKGWNRCGGWTPAVAYKHVFPRIVMASNPGGPSHTYLKRIFRIGTHPPETVFLDEEMKDPFDVSDKGWTTMFIPARMTDNKYLDKNYAGSFGALAPELRKAYIDGDWDAIVGAALHSLSKELHLVRPFKPPRFWTHFMTMDWGTASPFSIGWWCVVSSDSDGAIITSKDGWPEKFVPNGAIIRYAEYYGWNGKENEGCRLDSSSAARRIREIEKDRGDPVMDFRVADSQMWAQTDGSTPAEKMIAESILIRPNKKDRKVGYAEVLSRLAGNPVVRRTGEMGDYPMLYATSDCVHFWRTLPSLTLDETEADKGPDTKLEDHCVSGDTLVLANRGWIYITDVKDEDLLWDGIEWVHHHGLINQGMRETISLIGIQATPDHKFLVGEQNWATAAVLAGDESSLRRSLALGTANLPSWALIAARTVDFKRFAFSAPAGVPRMLSKIMDCLPRGLGGAENAPLKQVLARDVIDSATRISLKIKRLGNLFWQELALVLRAVIIPFLLPITVTGNGGFTSTRNGETGRTGRGSSWRTFCRSQDMTTEPSISTELITIRGMSPRTSGLQRSEKTWGTDERLLPSNNGSLSLRRVYDIRNSGSRRRFTILTQSGPLIASNCYDDVVMACRARPYMSTEDDRWEQDVALAKSLTEVSDPYKT